MRKTNQRNKKESKTDYLFIMLIILIGIIMGVLSFTSFKKFILLLLLILVGYAVIKLKNYYIAIMLISLPLFGFNVYHIGGFRIPLNLLAGFILIAYFLYNIYNGKVNVLSNSFTKYLIIFYFFATASVIGVFLYSNNFKTGTIEFIKSFIYLTFWFIIVFVISNFPYKKSLFLKNLKMFYILSIPILLYGIYQIPARILGLPFAFISESYFFSGNTATTWFGGYPRSSSLLGEPSWFAHIYLGFLIFFLVTIIFEKYLFKNKIYNYLMAILIFGSFLFSFSLGAYIVLAIVFSFIFFKISLRYKKRMIKFLIIFLLIFLLMEIILFSLTSTSLTMGLFSRYNKISLGNDGSLGLRTKRLIDGVDIFSEHPFTGVGLGNAMFFTKYGPWLDMVYIMFLAELGVFAAFFFVIIFAKSAFIKNPGSYSFLYSFVVFGSFTSLFMMGGVFDIGFLWVHLGILLYFLRVESSELVGEHNAN